MATNTGGRVDYEKGSEVRILKTDGKVSNEVYIIESERSDRKGIVLLQEKSNNRQVRVQFRRILPVAIEGQAVVIESGGKCRAICPQCNHVSLVDASDQFFQCNTHGEVPLYWLGVKPMTNSATKKPIQEQKSEMKNTPKIEKAEKAAKQPIVVDLEAIANTPHCELWTKKGVKFDHERVNVQAHTLLYVGNNPRKLCFNTYNGTIGKKTEELPIQQFVKNQPVTGNKKVWYAIKDLSLIHI